MNKFIDWLESKLYGLYDNNIPRYLKGKKDGCQEDK
jgi:hypothetical protein